MLTNLYMKTLPAGTYYIGDLCYCMHEEWDEVCNNIAFDGFGVHRLEDGRKYAILSTYFGDGLYHDQFGNTYSVDSGVIGAIALENITTNENRAYYEKLGVIHTFSEDFAVSDNDGILTFGHLEIVTR